MLRFETRFVIVVATSLALTLGVLGADGPTTLANNDSCDISVTPAATLLLPYFEVDLEDPTGETTVFSVTNVREAAQIARVTLWTDLSYPVITFNIYLTGYDVQKINLFEVLAGGGIALPRGTGTSVSPVGDLSEPNPRLDLSQCGAIPPRLDATAVARMHDAFTTGSLGDACDEIGHVHQNAVGYATIDVVGNCDATGPHDPEYFTRDLRYDNVLIGDYQQVNSQENFAQGSPMVHIRAIPEGSTPQIRASLSRYQTNFKRTFYGRFQSLAHPTLDARQPLPGTFAARWINGGQGMFQTSFTIWRQGITKQSANCAAFHTNELLVAESIAFDEYENGEGAPAQESCDFTCIPAGPTMLPNTARVLVEPGSETFPQSVLSTVVGGWVYLNLDDGVATNGAGQNWVVASMRAEGRYSVDFDVAWLGNGCSPFAPVTSYSDETLPPAGNSNSPTPAGAILPGPAADVNPR
jgi:hypothetical protein